MKYRLVHSRTPLRISFVGGGTDLPAFFRKYGGAVISTTISCYIDIVVKLRLVESGFKYLADNNIVDVATTINEIRAPLTGECLKQVGWGNADAVEILYSSDVPFGTGLGSSSAYTVGLLHALSTMRGENISEAKLAQNACRIEIDLLGKPIGYQDQYIVANGGLRRTTFHADDNVTSTLVNCPPQVMRAIEDRLLLFYLGGQRKADSILSDIQQSIESNRPILRKIMELCDDFEKLLAHGEQLNEVGEILDYGWRLKRSLNEQITNGHIDDVYRRSRSKGAIGGKLLGAGGTGFLLLFVPPERQRAVCEELGAYRRLPLSFDHLGSRIECVRS
jgi:D-glycero-alpha-D-manno-heptose-7-phosphate kinase